MRARQLRFLAVVTAAAGLAGCTHSYYTPNVIQLSPSGSSANPALEPISKSFQLTAIEDGYNSPFTADVVAGTCWVVQSPVSTGGAWIVVPQGTTCDKLDTEKILVKDQKGNSAATYIRGTK